MSEQAEQTEDESYKYETKCRRCGKVEEWVGSFKIMGNAQFLQFMQSQLASPRLFRCEACGKMTVQDLVSY